MKNPTTGQKGSIPQSSNKNDNINSHNNNNEYFWLPISDEPKAFTNKQTKKTLRGVGGRNYVLSNVRIYTATLLIKLYEHSKAFNTKPRNTYIKKIILGNGRGGTHVHKVMD